MTKKIFYKNREFHFLARRRTSFLIDHLIKSGEIKYNNLFYLKIPFKSLVKVKKGFADIYGDNKSLEYIKNTYFNYLFDKNNFQQLKRRIKKIGFSLESTTYNSKLDIKKFFKDYKRFSPSLSITTSLANKVQDLVLKRLKELKIDSSKLAIILHSTTKSSSYNERLSLLKIAKKIQEKSLDIHSKQFNKELKTHFNTYRHIPINYNGEPWTKDYFKNQIIKLTKTINCNNKIQSIKSRDDNELRRKKDFMKKLNLSEDRWLFDFATEFGNINEYRKDIISKANLVLKKILNDVCQKYSIKIQNIKNLSYNEILNLVEGKIDKNSLTSKINLRKKGFINISLNDVSTSYNFSKFNEPKELKNNTKTNNSIIYGSNASSGKVIGRIKFIENCNLDVKSEDILVTSMTSVDTIHFLKIASGIITNEGGITCHAAIIAREFDKPCLVGTENATKFFKEGDYVILNTKENYAKKIGKEEYLNLKNKLSKNI